eukprot:CAMPEP_0170744602 /NCGR_PEP_ID=MMETSP0437-20130122/7865_1 /TAXON_ID=0 /ORGANISM="Sexangularia sp." /LENGTH=688 /DNA_ID=CAMNT_0011083301 /DNA_START=99 /DNA_END=2162 /DNA_ORIENTATION=-
MAYDVALVRSGGDDTSPQSWHLLLGNDAHILDPAEVPPVVVVACRLVEQQHALGHLPRPLHHPAPATPAAAPASVLLPLPHLFMLSLSLLHSMSLAPTTTDRRHDNMTLAMAKTSFTGADGEQDGGDAVVSPVAPLPPTTHLALINFATEVCQTLHLHGVSLGDRPPSVAQQQRDVVAKLAPSCSILTPPPPLASGSDDVAVTRERVWERGRVPGAGIPREALPLSDAACAARLGRVDTLRRLLPSLSLDHSLSVLVGAGGALEAAAAAGEVETVEMLLELLAKPGDVPGIVVRRDDEAPDVEEDEEEERTAALLSEASLAPAFVAAASTAGGQHHRLDSVDSPLAAHLPLALSLLGLRLDPSYLAWLHDRSLATSLARPVRAGRCLVQLLHRLPPPRPSTSHSSALHLKVSLVHRVCGVHLWQADDPFARSPSASEAARALRHLATGWHAVAASAAGTRRATPPQVVRDFLAPGGLATLLPVALSLSPCLSLVPELVAWLAEERGESITQWTVLDDHSVPGDEDGTAPLRVTALHCLSLATARLHPSAGLSFGLSLPQSAPPLFSHSPTCTLDHSVFADFARSLTGSTTLSDPASLATLWTAHDGDGSPGSPTTIAARAAAHTVREGAAAWLDSRAPSATASAAAHALTLSFRAVPPLLAQAGLGHDWFLFLLLQHLLLAVLPFDAV